MINCPGFFKLLISLMVYRFCGVYGSYLSDGIRFHFFGESNGPTKDKSSPEVLVIVRACNPSAAIYQFGITSVRATFQFSASKSTIKDWKPAKPEKLAVGSNLC